MNPVKALRLVSNLTQQELADLGATAQSTIAAYESGHKSPTLRTLERLAHAAGLELTIQYHSTLTREDRRSLAYHCAVAHKIGVQPESTIERAKRHLAFLRNQHPHIESLASEWEQWLKCPLKDLVRSFSIR